MENLILIILILLFKDELLDKIRNFLRSEVNLNKVRKPVRDPKTVRFMRYNKNHYMPTNSSTKMHYKKKTNKKVE